MFGFILAACSAPELHARPDDLDFGEVDFAQEMPSEGYELQDVTLQNKSDSTLSLYITNFDFEHLCLQGFSEIPADLGSINPGSSYALYVSVCDYIEENGERDDLIEGEITIEYNDKYTLQIPWSFTPVLNLSTDTAR